MLDYSFFALLFLLATSLAPDAAVELSWINGSHPEQSITWTREGEGWAMRVNGREIGVFHRDGDTIVHHTGQREPDRHRNSELAAPFARDATRITLRGPHGPRVLTVERTGGQITLVDPPRELLRARLILRTR